MSVQPSNKKRILTNISWLLLEHGTRLIAGIFSASILARVLGVEGYGIFNYILGLTVIFQALSYINPAELMVPKLSNASTNERRQLMGNGFVIRLVSSIIAYLSLIAFVAVTDELLQLQLALLLGLMMLFNEAFGIVTAFLQSQTLMKYRSRLVMSIDAARALTLILLYWLGIESIFIYALVTVGQSVFLGIGLFFIYYYLTREGLFSFSFGYALKLLREGLPFFVGIVFMVVFWRLDLVFIRHLSDDYSLGLYASAIQLFGHAIVLAPILASSCAPLMVYKHSSIVLIKRNIWILSLAMFLIGSVSAAVLYWIAPLLISTIFGEQFIGSIDIFQHLLMVLPLFFLNEALTIYLIKIKLARWMIYKWVIVFIAAATAYYLLIPSFGAIGAVIGYGIGYIIACIIGLWVLLFYRVPEEKIHC